jgi:hypothetical protein
MSATSTRGNRKRWQIPVLFVSIFLLLSSGRMDSGDANAELAGSINLVETGSLGTPTPYSDSLVQSLFVRAPNGHYYEAHEIGNSLLLAPAAFGGHVLAERASRALESTSVDTGAKLTTLIAKTLASLIETILSAVGCFYLFLLFRLFYKDRAALVLTALFIFGTFYAGYFRSAWDVLPACNAVIVLLYYSARLALTPTVRRFAAVPIATWFGVACMFRLSLAPFLGLGLLILFWEVRHKLSRGAVLAAAVTAVIFFVPTLEFNAIRTGSPLRPANTLQQFTHQTGLNGNLTQGMIGLLLSPNHGLFVYSPILLLLILLPWYWKALPPAAALLLKAYFPSVFLYYLMIARMSNWGAAGLGPRYLLPVLPILFLGVGAIGYRMWGQSRIQRFALASLCFVSLTLSIPMLLVNHSNSVLRQYPDALTGTTLYPIQHIAVWRDLLNGLRGRPLQTRSNVGTDEETKLLAVFPDMLIMRVHQIVKGHSKIAGETLLLLYLCALSSTIYLIWRSVRGSEELTDEAARSARQTVASREPDFQHADDAAWK